MADRRRVDAISLPPSADAEGWTQAASMAELGVLTASLLHELRQPLFAIKAHAQLARVENADARGDRLDRILDQVRHIEELIRYYGGFAHVDTTPALFDVNEPIRAALEMLGHRATKARIELVSVLAPGALLVRGREVAVRQVAINLVHNAFDAVDGTEDRRVRVRTREDGDSVVVEVEDTGPGVPDDLRNRMFEPFVTTKSPGKGTGLGLYIARRLVDEAGGQLELAQSGESGSTFVVRLPRAV